MRHLSVAERIAAVAIALAVSCLVTGVFALTVAGLIWWKDVPLPQPTALFIATGVVVAAMSFVGMLWQFAVGHALPSEVWASLGRFFRDGQDLTP